MNNSTNVLLFIKIYWKIFLPLILALNFFYTSTYSLMLASWFVHTRIQKCMDTLVQLLHPSNNIYRDLENRLIRSSVAMKNMSSSARNGSFLCFTKIYLGQISFLFYIAVIFLRSNKRIHFFLVIFLAEAAGSPVT